MRQHKSGGRRFLFACIAASVTALLLLLTYKFAALKIGKVLFSLIMVGALIEIATSGHLASHLFAEERRNNTLGLLFSTGITATEVLLGKLAAFLVIPLSRLLTILPCLMMVPLLRAATPQVCAALIVTFLVLLALVVNVNLFASLVFDEHSSARTFADIFILVLLALAPAINLLNSHFTGMPLGRWWLCLTPGYAPWLLFQYPGAIRELPYIQLSNLFTAGISLLLFTGSAVMVSRAWRDQTTGPADTIRANLLSSLKDRRRRIAKSLLESNPYQWLIYRDFQPMLISSFALGSIAVIWLFGLWQWSGAWLVPLNFWATLLLISGVIRWMISYISAKQIGFDRSSGALELLLTSPLTVGDIIVGQQYAVRSYVRPLFYVVGALHLLFFILGFIFHPMNQTALINYTLISVMIAVLGPWFNFQQHWTTFWISLNTGRPGYALRKHLWEKAAYLWIFIQFYLQRDKIGQVPAGGMVETIIVASVAGFAFLCYFFYRMGWDRSFDKVSTQLRDKSILHMRPIAAEPVPQVNDPRLKKWDHNKSLFHPDPPNEKILV